MVRMFYGDFEFIPVPILNWTTNFLRDSKLEEIAIEHTLNLDGIILELAGESGNFSTVMQRRQALSDALASGNQEFIITDQGIPLVSGVFPKISDVNYEGDSSPQGTWADRLNFTATMTFTEDFYNTGITSFNETWAFEEQEDRRTVNVQHDISAVGQNTAGSGLNNAVSNARAFVLGRVGYGNVPPNHPAFAAASGTSTAFEGLRSEQVDVAAGSVSVSETFTLSSGNFTHVQEAAFEEDDSGVTTVSLNATVQGLGRGDVCFARALDAFNGSIRPGLPGDASGVYSRFGGSATLFTNDFSQFSVTQNEFLGTVTYQAAYTDDESDNLPSGVKDFSIQSVNNQPVKLFATFSIFERSLGNVVQDVGTPTEGTITITGSATGKQDFAFTDLKAFVEDEINAIRPLPANFVTLRQTQQQINEDEKSKTIQFSVQYTYTQSLSEAAIVGDVVLP